MLTPHLPYLHSFITRVHVDTGPLSAQAIVPLPLVCWWSWQYFWSFSRPIFSVPVQTGDYCLHRFHLPRSL